MNTQLPQPGPSGFKSSQLAGAASNTSLIGTNPECRHHLVHRDTANTATNNMTQHVQVQIVCKTRCSTNQKQHTVGYMYIHTGVNNCQLTIYHAAGVHEELQDHFIAAPYWIPPWSTKAVVRLVREIEHHDVVSTGICVDNLIYKHPQQSVKQMLFTLEMATEAYMVEAIAASHCLKQLLIPCRYSTCLLWWQG
jgi:hypothetical protein